MTDSPAQTLAATVRDTLGWFNIRSIDAGKVERMKAGLAALDALVALADGAAQLEAERDVDAVRAVMALDEQRRIKVAYQDKFLAAEERVAALTAWAATFNCFEPNEDGVPVCGGTCIPCSARAALGEAT